MQNAAVLGVLSAALATVPAPSANAQQPPKGWIQAGMNPGDYDMAVDAKGGRSGGTCAYIRAKTPDARTFGTLMQTFDAGDYKGKRLRLSGWVKSAGVDRWAGLWMRIDGPMDSRGPAMLGFDNMQNRPIKGTTDWKAYEVVLDVPQQAVTVNFGILLEGAGHAWLDGVRFDVVGPEVPVTDVRKDIPKDIPKKPVNLDFEQP
jgi:hypothetical protein